MQIIEPSKRGVSVSYSRAFYFNVRRTWGCSFPCDEKGHVDTSKLMPAGLDNYRQCLTGTQTDGNPVIDGGIERNEHHYYIPPVGRCVICRRHVPLSGFTNTCDCGADYSSCGQLLAHRSQWGEETGETAADILACEFDGCDL